MKKVIWVFGIVALVLLSLSGCSKENKSESELPVTEPIESDRNYFTFDSNDNLVDVRSKQFQEAYVLEDDGFYYFKPQVFTEEHALYVFGQSESDLEIHLSKIALDRTLEKHAFDIEKTLEDPEVIEAFEALNARIQSAAFKPCFKKYLESISVTPYLAETTEEGGYLWAGHVLLYAPTYTESISIVEADRGTPLDYIEKIRGTLANEGTQTEQTAVNDVGTLGLVPLVTAGVYTGAFYDAEGKMVYDNMFMEVLSNDSNRLSMGQMNSGNVGDLTLESIIATETLSDGRMRTEYQTEFGTVALTTSKSSIVYERTDGNYGRTELMLANSSMDFNFYEAGLILGVHRNDMGTAEIDFDFNAFTLTRVTENPVSVRYDYYTQSYDSEYVGSIDKGITREYIKNGEVVLTLFIVYEHGDVFLVEEGFEPQVNFTITNRLFKY